MVFTMAGNPWPEVGKVSTTTVRISVCVSLDGRVALSDDAPPNQEKFGGWTSPDDKKIFKDNVEWADFLIVGSKTLMQSPIIARLGKPIVVVSNGSPPIIPTDRSFLRYVVKPNKTSLVTLLDMFAGKKLLLCGGIMTYGTFLQFDLVDEISMVVEPVILNSGPSFASNLISSGTGKYLFELLEVHRTNNGQTVHMRYKRKNT